jgi:hypothetical protein
MKEMKIHLHPALKAYQTVNRTNNLIKLFDFAVETELAVVYAPPANPLFATKRFSSTLVSFTL